MRQKMSSTILIMFFLFTSCSMNPGIKDEVSANSSIAEANQEVESSVDENILNESSSNQDDSILSGYAEIDNLIKENVSVSEDEEVEYAEWNENKEIFRIAVQRKEEVDLEYRHIKDYFFVRDGSVSWFVVDYPDSDDIYADRYVESACDFGYEYVDVTFDGHKDIVIFLGYQGSHGTSKNCVYVYNDGEYEYVQSFEDIPNYSIDNKERVVCGSYNSSNTEYVEVKYEYIDASFVKVWESRESFDE